MRPFIAVILLLACGAVDVFAKSGRKLPGYIKPCSSSASSQDFKKCIKEHAAEAIPFLLKGDPSFKLPVLVPFQIEKVELKPSAQITLVLEDVKLYGVDTITVKDADIDLKSKNLKVLLNAKRIKILAKYKANGQLLVLPIQGEGPAELTFDDCDIDYMLNYDLIDKQGAKYVNIVKTDLKFKVSKAHYQLENLFNGNKELSENTNKVLNENSQEVLKDFKGAVSQIVQVVATRILNSFFTAVPYGDLFLP